MSSQLQVTGEAKIRDIQGPVVANSGVITALDGAASQYVRGDGTLADFPTSGGGGSSVSYYLNGSVSQGNIGGSVYYEMSKTPVIGTGTDFSISSNDLIAQFITDANDPSLLEVPGGNFNLEFYFSVNNNTGNPYVFAELYKYNGSTFTLLGSSQAIPEYITQGTTIAPYYFAIPVATAALTITDRIAIKIFANVDGRTVTLHTENSHLCQVVTTFSKGLTALNNLTDQVQYFGTGTSGSDFNIASSGNTHTFNIPNAGTSSRGLITSGIQSIGGAKTFSDLLTAAYVNINGVLTLYSNLSNGTFNYTLPSANGQLALTSQIPSISGTAYQVTRYNVAGTGLEGGSITDNGTLTGSPSGLVTINSRLTVNNYAEINRYLSIIQNVDSSWALPSTGTSLEAFITSAAGGVLVSDTGYLRPRKASDDTFKRFIIQGDDLILNDSVRRTLINKAGPTQSTTKLEVAGYTRFDSNININSTLYFNATDASQPTYLSASSGNVTLMTTGQITLGTNSVSKFVFDVNGALNLGTSDNSNIININNQFSTLNSTIQGVHITPSIVSDTPVIYTGVKSYPQFFLSTVGNYAQVTHFAALNASNTRDTATQVGLYIENLSSIGSAYGVQSLINSGTNRYNLYLSGTANNYIKGNLGIDQTNPLYAIDVTGDVNVTGNFKVNGTNLTQGVSGAGTQHYIPKFTSATSVGNSLIYQAPASGHLLVNTTFDYSASGGYLQVAGGFTTESFANIIYGSALFAGNSVYLKLVNGNTIQGIGDRTYFIENRVNAGATSANYYLNYWDGGTTYTRYSLDNTGLHAFSGDMTLSGSLLSPLNVITNDNNFAFNIELKNTNNGTQALTGVGISNLSGTRKGQILWIPSNYITTSLQNSFLVSSVTNIPLVLCADATGAATPNIKFQSGAADRMTLFGDTGNLAIGFSTDNGARLSVAGAATFSSSVIANSLSTPSTGGAGSTTWNFYHDQYAAGDFGLWAGATNRILINAAGNVGIGTSSPIANLEVSSANSTGFFRVGSTSSGTAGSIDMYASGTGGFNAGAVGFNTSQLVPIIFSRQGTESMRITSGGYAKFSNNGAYVYPTNSFFEVNQSIADWTQVNVNKVGSGTPLGIFIGFTALSPNSTSAPFIQAQDSTAERFTVRSNGGIANYQANDVNLSDERTKKDIIPLESYWDKFKAIEIVKFKYKDQTHDDFNIGVIAQQVEKIAPEFVDIDSWGKTKIGEDVNEVIIDEEPIKSVYTSDLHHATIKVLQEAMAKIESLEQKVKQLENK